MVPLCCSAQRNAGRSERKVGKDQALPGCFRNRARPARGTGGWFTGGKLLRSRRFEPTQEKGDSRWLQLLTGSR